MKKIYLLILVPFFTFQAFAQDEAFRKLHEAFGNEYAIAMQGPGAADAAKKIFDQGGNIFDAAVAASFSMSVERPQSTGIGGGGFMLIHVAKENQTYALDFREKAPLRANKKLYLDKDGKSITDKSDTGIFSVGTPGIVAGLVEIHRSFGKLSFDKLLEPAISLAENGAVVSKHMYDKLVSEKATLFKSPDMRKTFYHKDGTPLQIGEKFIQKDLAKSLREIQAHGRDGFYDSWITDAWVKTSQKAGGNQTRGDFDAYRAKFRKPVTGTFHGVKIVSMSPPSSGGVALVQILETLNKYDLKKYGRSSPKTIHLVSSAMQLAYHDRYLYMGDPDFADIPTKSLVSQERIKEFQKLIPADHALKSSELSSFMSAPHFESTDTAHFSMMDKEGNAVSTTQSLNGYFGSGLMAEGTGIVMNNTMDDFTIEQAKPNSWGAFSGPFNQVDSQKRPMSSMSPTIILDAKNKPIMAIGTPDGPRIITCIAQTLLNYFEFKMPLPDSISALRYHDQWDPDEIRVDTPGFPSETTKALEKMGHKVTQKDFFCKVQAVAAENGSLHAFSDLRGLESVALGK